MSDKADKAAEQSVFLAAVESWRLTKDFAPLHDAVRDLIGRLSNAQGTRFRPIGLESADVQQELWVVALDVARCYRAENGPFENYFIRAATNRINDLRGNTARKVAQGQAPYVSLEDPDLAGARESSDPIVALASAAGQAVKWNLLTGREVLIVQAHMASYSYEDIARMLGVSSVTAKNWLVKAIDKLRSAA